jgi:hypothetical protein
VPWYPHKLLQFPPNFSLCQNKCLAVIRINLIILVVIFRFSVNIPYDHTRKLYKFTKEKDGLYQRYEINILSIYSLCVNPLAWSQKQVKLFRQVKVIKELVWIDIIFFLNLAFWQVDSCGTVALMVLGQFSDICRPLASRWKKLRQRLYLFVAVSYAYFSADLWIHTSFSMLCYYNNTWI